MSLIYAFLVRNLQQQIQEKDAMLTAAIETATPMEGEEELMPKDDTPEEPDEDCKDVYETETETDVTTETETEEEDDDGKPDRLVILHVHTMLQCII